MHRHSHPRTSLRFWPFGHVALVLFLFGSVFPLSPALAVAVASTPATPSSSGSVDPLVNLELALAPTLEAQQAGSWVSFMAGESNQGETDLNGDGDAQDNVLYLLDVSTHELTNSGLAVELSSLVPGRAAMVVSEENQGGADLNGDGDALDNVLFTQTPGSAPANLGLAVHSHVLGSDFLAFTVNEWEQGNQDLNDDGDASDRVLFVLADGDLAPRNLGAVALLVPGTASGPRFGARDGFAAVVAESVAAGVDHNGDGDLFDHVLFTCLSPCQQLESRGLATFPRLFEQRRIGDHVLLAVSEFQQGQTDFNLDGDLQDRIPHAVPLGGGPTLRADFALDDGSYFVGERSLATFLVSEVSQGGVDLNGDGDAQDRLAAALHLGTGQARIFSLGLTTFVASVRAGWVQIYDYPFGTHVWHPGLDDLRELTAFGPGELSRGWSAVLRLEFQFDEDFNGDGDQSDYVLAAYAPGGELENLALAARFGPSTPSGEMLAKVLEQGQGFTDLNQDGDTDDQVLHLVHPPGPGGTFEVENLGVALDVLHPGSLVLTPQALLFTLREQESGTDLNGDGDILDSVLHLLPRQAAGPNPGA